MANYLQYAGGGIPSRLAAKEAMLETEIFKRRRIRASCAELLDSNGKAM